MAHTLNPVTIHAHLRGYSVQVEAGLEAFTELAGRAGERRALRQEIVEHRALAESGNDTARSAAPMATDRPRR